MSMERGGNSRGAYDAGPHSFIVINTAQMSISSFMGYLKGKSAMMAFDKHSNLKYKFGNRNLGNGILCQYSRPQ